MSREEAHETGLALAELILLVYAGQQILFPAHPFRARTLEERNEEIRGKFTGKNAPLLALEYGMSRRQIWNIVKSDD